ncbi:hypothetical protein [Flavobacterium sp.]|uniref:hypothetical protein n=1 Tax=Flavobacterium sp. TaxID=239 RepID=UPI0040474B6D
MTKYKIVFLLFISNIFFGQTVYLKDSLTKNTIPFVNAVYFNADNNISGGNYCDANGSLTIGDSKVINKIEFSCTGYESLIIEKALLQDTIYLKSSQITLNEVVLTNYSEKDLNLIGYNNLKKKFSISGGKGIECSVFIENNFKAEKKIQSFLFRVEKKNKKRVAVRIHLYKSNSDNEPAEELIKNDIIYYVDKSTKGEFEVNLSSYNLVFPKEGVFIGIEWLGIVGSSGDFLNDNISNIIKIEYNDNIDKPITFFRNRFKIGEWNNTEQLKKNLGETIKFKNYPNASFGIKVSEQN